MRTNLIKTKELPKVVEPSTTDGMLDMVIAFDTTGSMSAYINREVIRANKASNIQSYLYKSAQARAKQRNIEFNIELEDVIVPERCPILGIEMSFHSNRKEDNSYSLDRIDPNKGYIKGNIWVISLRANRIKNDATVSELRMIADAIEQKLLGG